MVDRSPDNSPHGDLTRQLRRWVDGEAGAREEVINQAYGQLKQLARQRLSRERDGHTLQPTALVHEAWLKLAQNEPVDWRDRVHFVAVAARAMRQILVDAGRRRSAEKRDASNLTTIQLQAEAESPHTVEILDLDEALIELEKLDVGQAQVVELRYFGGLTIEETAALLDLSVATVNRDWRAARAWLFVKLNEAGSR
ncbi:MAG: ECF-type sigma factor [Wenzhouxiangella sp.]|jgi:RNA polymerase sigma factor (TIGR02999 family)|nr:ECF-type sigma factor [Wenzhouxiangella sp.]